MSFTKIEDRPFSAGRVDHTDGLLRVAVQQCRHRQRLDTAAPAMSRPLDRLSAPTCTETIDIKGKT
ncbi:hypothetical protein [Saccharopolyspora phatthalungensis]|uniref:Uncharacterized protein n=1 Tax=Saccharopolyspora phatthalungensis TaxID=664693 RepID=A0A840QBG4_9PSEU|nr:hypothetical protein [Saccharopolyspora phatthalungensis]MBB5154193.1 hypothetical protein [Saccharopolyspora phatthalungensis]